MPAKRKVIPTKEKLVPTKDIIDVTEQKRLNEARERRTPWKKWGPYLSERQWGMVREDYSSDGHAWDYFSHDQSRSRADQVHETYLFALRDYASRIRLCLLVLSGSHHQDTLFSADRLAPVMSRAAQELR